ncbi:hypothetical protein Catovirus_1_1050 [Catovirus CTV1]|uniref:Uncharacterized protein n=1 Tax=Catovirus CTV1 TaxID=1977631 RepID=A0A1V0SB93_9VIRU|nr:hypothetical protein Catovirus_1_1050 [Catovirus CTV1]
MKKEKYLKSIIKENNAILDKYKKILLGIEKLEKQLNNKINRKNAHLENVKNMYLENMDIYHKICNNLL